MPKKNAFSQRLSMILHRSKTVTPLCDAPRSMLKPTIADFSTSQVGMLAIVIALRLDASSIDLSLLPDVQEHTTFRAIPLRRPGGDLLEPYAFEMEPVALAVLRKDVSHGL